jgi:hypothetical protein
MHHVVDHRAVWEEAMQFWNHELLEIAEILDGFKHQPLVLSCKVAQRKAPSQTPHRQSQACTIATQVCHTNSLSMSKLTILVHGVQSGVTSTG